MSPRPAAPSSWEGPQLLPALPHPITESWWRFPCGKVGAPSARHAPPSSSPTSRGQSRAVCQQAVWPLLGRKPGALPAGPGHSICVWSLYWDQDTRKREQRAHTPLAGSTRPSSVTDLEPHTPQGCSTEMSDEQGTVQTPELSPPSACRGRRWPGHRPVQCPLLPVHLGHLRARAVPGICGTPGWTAPVGPESRCAEAPGSRQAGGGAQAGSRWLCRWLCRRHIQNEAVVAESLVPQVGPVGQGLVVLGTSIEMQKPRAPHH